MALAMSFNKSDFSYLDSADLRPVYVQGTEDAVMDFYVKGIRCGRCVQKLEQLPIYHAGVLNVRVQLAQKSARVSFQPKIIQPSEIARLIVDLGYQPVPLSHQTSLQTMSLLERRQIWLRLGVAAACAGNIMVFSFANYFGASSELSQVFNWLSFLLYLPVVTYVAKPFYVNALLSLKSRTLSIDLPIAVASLTGFVFSTVELLRGRPDVYFDSLSGFLFLILLARAFQAQLQDRFLSEEEFASGLSLERMRKVVGSDWKWCARSNVKAGDRIILNANEILACDGILDSFEATFSLAWLSGESHPKRYSNDALIPAGAKLLSNDATLVVKHPLEESEFGRILQSTSGANHHRSRLSQISDQWASRLLVTVFVLAGLLILIMWNQAPEEAIGRALALIILACPCAMAFGTPLALSSALRKARKAGLIVKDVAVLDRVRKVCLVAFDKTGTLTESNLELVENSADVPPVFQKIIMALEAESHHPIGFAFRDSFANQESRPPVDGWRECPGTGVSGWIYGRFYELKPIAHVKRDISCGLFEDGVLRRHFTFRTKPRPKARPTVLELKQRGLQVALLSGDSSTTAEAMGQDLGFAKNEIHLGMSPCEKAAWVSQRRNVMMIGDGINDSIALMRADVGVAASGGIETALKSSDVYMTQTSLGGISKLFEIANESHKHVKQNLYLSLTYNTVGGALAIMGFINPFMAALLMPASSGLIAFLSWVRDRR